MKINTIRGEFVAKKFFSAFKAADILLTFIFPVTMDLLAGAGLLSHADSYGGKISALGVLLMISGLLMTSGTVMCMFRKRILCIAAATASAAGLGICLTALFMLCSHARSAGWISAVTMLPADSMYKARILPCIIPAAMSVSIAMIHIAGTKNAVHKSRRS